MTTNELFRFTVNGLLWSAAVRRPIHPLREGSVTIRLIFVHHSLMWRLNAASDVSDAEDDGALDHISEETHDWCVTLNRVLYDSQVCRTRTFSTNSLTYVQLCNRQN